MLCAQQNNTKKKTRNELIQLQFVRVCVDIELLREWNSGKTLLLFHFICAVCVRVVVDILWNHLSHSFEFPSFHWSRHCSNHMKLITRKKNKNIRLVRVWKQKMQSFRAHAADCIFKFYWQTNSPNSCALRICVEHKTINLKHIKIHSFLSMEFCPSREWRFYFLFVSLFRFTVVLGDFSVFLWSFVWCNVCVCMCVCLLYSRQ